MYKIKLRRAYDEKGTDDGYRVLVDRMWPRGIKKEDLSYSWWPKEIAPSKELIEWFGHDPDKFDSFKKDYKKELEKNELKDEFIDKVEKQLQKHNVTFVFGAKDTEHNQAVVLKEWMKEKLG
ncbi:MAG: DUF488 domain-containing protein [Alkalibacterium gilvum]|uniref:Uncharacterized conserved protein YeaO, DUF488 family n=1 Tax=Alkalibacterium gilvum TaxID=1130080 RepID=A0A1H6S308_9LACT|nr:MULTISPECIES: DUF488 family protein [Alkalibacterium]MDN6294419.1 DUF488 family protein [Alkalibacterium sp.]MDN6296073.1 DUF488 family protein [Alkalibacterium sp.]MDN6398002.1 DUF488 family protein [Alkalibacterium sp.]MDN6729626.1 DUF488 family protein [Alkalibacterium sp.]SEI58420.1 Uncharacterized conserved protein YeaO, DUF488 family [Alkalibacterium gilvum]